MFYGLPILPMEGLYIVVNDHKAYTAQRVSSKGLFSGPKAIGNTTTQQRRLSLRTWPIPVSTRQFLRAQQQHRLLNGTLSWKPTGLHIMVVSEEAGLRVPKPKERGGRDEKLHGQNGMRCTRLYRTVSP